MSVDFDNKNQLDRIQGGLVPGETLYAVYDMKGGGSGFIGLTDRRLIIQDEGRLRKRKSIVSIPYGQIAMVAAADEGRVIRSTSELTIVTSNGQHFDMEFRSGDKAERAYTYIIQHLK
jgi:hypothetical protein